MLVKIVKKRNIFFIELQSPQTMHINLAGGYRGIFGKILAGGYRGIFRGKPGRGLPWHIVIKYTYIYIVIYI